MKFIAKKKNYWVQDLQRLRRYIKENEFVLRVLTNILIIILVALSKREMNSEKLGMKLLNLKKE